MIESILKEHAGELMGTLTERGGLDASQAEGLLPPALGGIGEALAGGNLDLGSLLSGGGASELMSRLDIAGIASQAGLDEGQAQGGLAALLPVALQLLGDKAGGAEGLLSMLGGETSGAGKMGGLLGAASKLFGK